MKLLVKVHYDGTKYNGFQVQPGIRTIQGTLCDSFESLLGFRCDITGCSRTDSGVHAREFCATVCPHDKKLIDTKWCTIPASKVNRAINVILPEDISVSAACYMDDDFHPRYDVERKEYVYRIWDSPVRNPFLHGYVYELGRPLDDEKLAKMKKLAEKYIGTHDFAGFMAVGAKKPDTTVRTVKTVDIYRDNDGAVCFSVSADGFLYNMVRIMAGTILMVTLGQLSEESMDRALKEGIRKNAGFTAPAEGLYLNKVYYKIPINWECE